MLDCLGLVLRWFGKFSLQSSHSSAKAQTDLFLVHKHGIVERCAQLAKRSFLAHLYCAERSGTDLASSCLVQREVMARPQCRRISAEKGWCKDRILSSRLEQGQKKEYTVVPSIPFSTGTAEVVPSVSLTAEKSEPVELSSVEARVVRVRQSTLPNR